MKSKSKSKRRPSPYRPCCGRPFVGWDTPSSIRPAIEELERLYVGLLDLFPGEHRERMVVDGVPVILVQHDQRATSYGWMAPLAWSAGRKSKARNEISLTAEYLAREMYAPRGIGETLLHEMVHHANSLAGVSDCSDAQYHNKRFAALAEEVGLSFDGEGCRTRKGWSSPILGPRSRAALEALEPREEVFAMFRRGAGLGRRAKQTTRMKKWTCGCTIVRCAVDLQATCAKCGEPFERQD